MAYTGTPTKMALARLEFAVAILAASAIAVGRAVPLQRNTVWGVLDQHLANGTAADILADALLDALQDNAISPSPLAAAGARFGSRQRVPPRVTTSAGGRMRPHVVTNTAAVADVSVNGGVSNEVTGGEPSVAVEAWSAQRQPARSASKPESGQKLVSIEVVRVDESAGQGRAPTRRGNDAAVSRGAGRRGARKLRRRRPTGGHRRRSHNVVGATDVSSETSIPQSSTQATEHREVKNNVHQTTLEYARSVDFDAAPLGTHGPQLRPTVVSTKPSGGETRYSAHDYAHKIRGYDAHQAPDQTRKSVSTLSPQDTQSTSWSSETFLKDEQFSEDYGSQRAYGKSTRVQHGASTLTKNYEQLYISNATGSIGQSTADLAILSRTANHLNNSSDSSLNLKRRTIQADSESKPVQVLTNSRRVPHVDLAHVHLYPKVPLLTGPSQVAVNVGGLRYMQAARRVKFKVPKSDSGNVMPPKGYSLIKEQQFQGADLHDVFTFVREATTEPATATTPAARSSTVTNHETMEADFSATTTPYSATINSGENSSIEDSSRFPETATEVSVATSISAAEVTTKTTLTSEMPIPVDKLPNQNRYDLSTTTPSLIDQITKEPERLTEGSSSVDNSGDSLHHSLLPENVTADWAPALAIRTSTPTSQVLVTERAPVEPQIAADGARRSHSNDLHRADEKGASTARNDLDESPVFSTPLSDHFGVRLRLPAGADRQGHRVDDDKPALLRARSSAKERQRLTETPVPSGMILNATSSFESFPGVFAVLDSSKSEQRDDAAMRTEGAIYKQTSAWANRDVELTTAADVDASQRFEPQNDYDRIVRTFTETPMAVRATRQMTGGTYTTAVYGGSLLAIQEPPMEDVGTFTKHATPTKVSLARKTTQTFAEEPIGFSKAYFADFKRAEPVDSHATSSKLKVSPDNATGIADNEKEDSELAKQLNQSSVLHQDFSKTSKVFETGQLIPAKSLIGVEINSTSTTESYIVTSREPSKHSSSDITETTDAEPVRSFTTHDPANFIVSTHEDEPTTMAYEDSITRSSLNTTLASDTEDRSLLEGNTPPESSVNTLASIFNDSSSESVGNDRTPVYEEPIIPRFFPELIYDSKLKTNTETNKKTLLESTEDYADTYPTSSEDTTAHSFDQPKTISQAQVSSTGSHPGQRFLFMDTQTSEFHAGKTDTFGDARSEVKREKNSPQNTKDYTGPYPTNSKDTSFHLVNERDPVLQLQVNYSHPRLEQRFSFVDTQLTTMRPQEIDILAGTRPKVEQANPHSGKHNGQLDKVVNPNSKFDTEAPSRTSYVSNQTTANAGIKTKSMQKIDKLNVPILSFGGNRFAELGYERLSGGRLRILLNNIMVIIREQTIDSLADFERTSAGRHLSDQKSRDIITETPAPVNADTALGVSRSFPSMPHAEKALFEDNFKLIGPTFAANKMRKTQDGSNNAGTQSLHPSDGGDNTMSLHRNIPEKSQAAQGKLLAAQRRQQDARHGDKSEGLDQPSMFVDDAQHLTNSKALPTAYGVGAKLAESQKSAHFGDRTTTSTPVITDDTLAFGRQPLTKPAPLGADAADAFFARMNEERVQHHASNQSMSKDISSDAAWQPHQRANKNDRPSDQAVQNIFKTQSDGSGKSQADSVPSEGTTESNLAVASPAGMTLADLPSSRAQEAAHYDKNGSHTATMPQLLTRGVDQRRLSLVSSVAPGVATDSLRSIDLHHDDRRVSPISLDAQHLQGLAHARPFVDETRRSKERFDDSNRGKAFAHGSGLPTSVETDVLSQRADELRAHTGAAQLLAESEKKLDTGDSSSNESANAVKRSPIHATTDHQRSTTPDVVRASGDTSAEEEIQNEPTNSTFLPDRAKHAQRDFDIASDGKQHRQTVLNKTKGEFALKKSEGGPAVHIDKMLEIDLTSSKASNDADASPEADPEVRYSDTPISAHNNHQLHQQQTRPQLRDYQRRQNDTTPAADQPLPPLQNAQAFEDADYADLQDGTQPQQQPRRHPPIVSQQADRPGVNDARWSGASGADHDGGGSGSSGNGSGDVSGGRSVITDVARSRDGHVFMPDAPTIIMQVPPPQQPGARFALRRIPARISVPSVYEILDPSGRGDADAVFDGVTGRAIVTLPLLPLRALAPIHRHYYRYGRPPQPLPLPPQSARHSQPTKNLQQQQQQHRQRLAVADTADDYQPSHRLEADQGFSTSGRWATQRHQTLAAAPGRQTQSQASHRQQQFYRQPSYQQKQHHTHHQQHRQQQQFFQTTRRQSGSDAGSPSLSSESLRRRTQVASNPASHARPHEAPPGTPTNQQAAQVGALTGYERIFPQSYRTPAGDTVYYFRTTR